MIKVRLNLGGRHLQKETWDEGACHVEVDLVVDVDFGKLGPGI
jgi:hypothetical protein